MGTLVLWGLYFRENDPRFPRIGIVLSRKPYLPHLSYFRDWPVHQGPGPAVELIVGHPEHLCGDDPHGNDRLTGLRASLI